MPRIHHCLQFADRARWWMVALAILLTLGPPLLAQSVPSILVRLGTEGQSTFQPGDTLSVPIVVDPSPTSSPATNVASLTALVSWAPCLELLDMTPGTFGVMSLGSVVLGTAGTGSQQISLSSLTGVKTAFVLVTYTFRAQNGCHGRIAARGLLQVTMLAVGNAAGASLRDSIARVAGTMASPVVASRAVCVGYRGPWGSVRANQAVSIIDAQQIADWSVNLVVLAPERLPVYGDVTGDSSVDILDAQQIARYAVNLPTSSRAGQPGPDQCLVAPLGLARSLQMGEGNQLKLSTGHSARISAFVVNGSPDSSYGRYDYSPIRWTSSDSTILKVDSTGLVTALAPGRAVASADATRSGLPVSGSMLFSVIGITAVSPPTSAPVTVVAAATPGAGRVTSVPMGIDCRVSNGVAGGTCSLAFPAQTIVTLTASAASGSSFDAWSGSMCSSTATCSFVADSLRTVTAAFSSAPGQQTVTVTGTGSGTITSSPNGIYCSVSAGTMSGICAMNVATQALVSLVASPASTAAFGSWSGSCKSTITTCTMTASQSDTARVVFSPASSGERSLTLQISLNDMTFVQSTYSGVVHGQATLSPVVRCQFPGLTPTVACGPYRFPLGQEITLQLDSANTLVSSWDGGCGGVSQSCQLNMSTDRVVKVRLDLATTLRVLVRGSGRVSAVTASSDTLPCVATSAAECRLLGPGNALLTLVAHPGAGFGVQKWESGGVFPSNPCQQVSHDNSTCLAYHYGDGGAVVAFFTPLRGLTVATTGTGSGSFGLTGSLVYKPANALPSYSRMIPDSTLVSLSAIPDAGITFGGWSGACQSSSPFCRVTLLASGTVTARFDSVFVLTAITGAGDHACGLTPQGAAMCWGGNSNGQLGSGGLTGTARTALSTVVGGLSFQSIVAAPLHTCGLISSGAAYCWGYNANGGLGDGTISLRTAPTLVSGGMAFRLLSGGVGHTCGVTVTDVAFCWGNNSSGELGDGTTIQRLTPAAVAGGLALHSITAGAAHTCALTVNGAAYCWGSAAGTATPTATPTRVAGGLVFQSISAGEYHTCGLTSSGTAYCWGLNLYGALGDGSTTDHLTPAPVAGGLTFKGLATGYYHTCGVTSSGAAYCWGNNSNGELGDGTISPHLTPVAVGGGLEMRSLSAGAGSTCGLTTVGAAYCWGYKLGTERRLNIVNLSPVPVLRY